MNLQIYTIFFLTFFTSIAAKSYKDVSSVFWILFSLFFLLASTKLEALDHGVYFLEAGFGLALLGLVPNLKKAVLGFETLSLFFLIVFVSLMCLLAEISTGATVVNESSLEPLSLTYVAGTFSSTQTMVFLVLSGFVLFKLSAVLFTIPTIVRNYKSAAPFAVLQSVYLYLIYVSLRPFCHNKFNLVLENHLITIVSIFSLFVILSLAALVGLNLKSFKAIKKGEEN